MKTFITTALETTNLTEALRTGKSDDEAVHHMRTRAPLPSQKAKYATQFILTQIKPRATLISLPKILYNTAQ